MKSLCPHTEPFVVGGKRFTAQDLIRTLEPYISETRRKRIQEVVSGRTYTIVPVLEGLYDQGNASAVMRTAEALGYQALHIIELSNQFKKANRVTQGAEKWLDISRWNDTKACVAHLKSQGYRIFVTHFDHAHSLAEFQYDGPTAIFFGNEKDGVTPELLEAADARVVIPMVGFTHSFNISVAAAVCLYHIRHARIQQRGSHGDLNEEEQTRLIAEYYRRSVLPGASGIIPFVG